MVYGACYTPLSNETELAKLGFAGKNRILSTVRFKISILKKPDYLETPDSKTLNDEKREQLFKKIRNSDSIGWIVNVLSASELSASMLQTLVFPI